MNHSKHFSLRHSLIGLGLVSASLFGLLAGCSSDGGNPGPSGPPVVGPGGNGNGSGGEAGAGDTPQGGGSSDAGASNGGSSGDAGQSNVAGDTGEGGEAGSNGIVPTCPSDDLGFLNQSSKSQKEVFDNEARLGSFARLPPLN